MPWAQLLAFVAVVYLNGWLGLQVWRQLQRLVSLYRSGRRNRA